jgi:hypothetical protein
MNEIWKDINGYQGVYQVSNLGRVRSLDRQIVYLRRGKLITSKHRGRIMKGSYTEGYLRIQLGKYGLRDFIHRLVAQAFIPNPENKPEVNHINLIRDDNRVENLEWVTASENVIHGHYTKKYQTQEIRVIKNGVVYTFRSQNEAKRAGVAAISRLVNGTQLETNGYRLLK